MELMASKGEPVTEPTGADPATDEPRAGLPWAGPSWVGLPWQQIPIADLAEDRYREVAALTHRRLVEAARTATTAVDRLRRLGSAVGEVYTGLEPADGETLADGWLRLLADLAACPADLRAGWIAAYGESTGGWWPPGSKVPVRGLVNAVIRSPEAEHLHTGDTVNFFDNQIGAMCANWAAVSLLDGILDPADPSGWGIEAAAGDYYGQAGDRFPVAASLLVALGEIAAGGERGREVDLTEEGSAEAALAWLTEHAGLSSSLRPDRLADPLHRTAHASIGVERHAWTGPRPDELERLRGHTVIVSGLTRLSRDPRHLAAVLQWAARTGTTIVSANACFDAGYVALRQPLLPAPADLSNRGSGQADHLQTWRSLEGLDPRHARRVLEAIPDARPRLGRNDPCWCGSGWKVKY